MEKQGSFSEMIRSLIEDVSSAKALTRQIEARTADPQLVERLIAYARQREVSPGHALVRKMLTAAGVSWEAL